MTEEVVDLVVKGQVVDLEVVGSEVVEVEEDVVVEVNNNVVNLVDLIDFR